ncbi:MAG: transporter [Cytophagales bacterium]|nr:transporter [Cytophagales bacterium]
MVIRFYLSIFIFLFGFVALAQINTDRPTQSASAFVLPNGAFQVEAGFLSERPMSRSDVYNVQYVNTLFRYGIVEGIELRLIQSYQGHRAGGVINGLGPTTLGGKFHLVEESGGIPQISIIGQATLTNGDKAFSPNNAVYELRANFQNTLSDRFGLGYNLGVISTEGESRVGLYSVIMGIAIANDLTFFVEPYGFFAKNTPNDARFNTGVIYLVSDNFQLDISAGNALSKKAPDYFLSFGAAMLF